MYINRLRLDAVQYDGSRGPMILSLNLIISLSLTLGSTRRSTITLNTSLSEPKPEPNCRQYEEEHNNLLAQPALLEVPQSPSPDSTPM